MPSERSNWQVIKLATKWPAVAFVAKYCLCRVDGVHICHKRHDAGEIVKFIVRIVPFKPARAKSTLLNDIRAIDTPADRVFVDNARCMAGHATVGFVAGFLNHVIKHHPGGDGRPISGIHACLVVYNYHTRQPVASGERDGIITLGRPTTAGEVLGL